MKFLNKIFRIGFFVTVAAILLLASVRGADKAPSGEMYGVKFPLEVYDNGVLKTMVMAGKISDVMSGGFVEGEKVKFESFTKNGDLDIVMKADRCSFNKDKGIIKSDSKIIMEKEGVRITGVGFEWISAKEAVKIKSNVRVVFSREIVGK